MRIDFLVEEPSMKVLLKGLLPRLLPSVECEIFDFSSKQQLLIRLPDRLKGYAGMFASGGYEELRVVVMVDRDEDDCSVLKETLEAAARTAGLSTLTSARPSPGQPPNAPFKVLNRVVCEELEAWYFGDPTACQLVYSRLKKAHFSTSHLHAPDAIKGGTWEAFGRTLTKAGHLPANPPNHRWKYDAAEAIGLNLNLAANVNQSSSFQAFISGVLSF